MMRLKLLTIMMAACVTSANAVSLLNINLTADGTSRFTDHLSAAYAQLNLDPDGMYLLSNDSQVGTASVFTSGANWDDIGTLTLSGDITGSGVETFSITNAIFDFNQYINIDDASVYSGATGMPPDGSVPYTTSFSITTGSAEFTNGVLTDLDLSGDMTFSIVGFFAYDGSFSMDESSYTLNVDDSVQPSPASPFIRHQWESTGSTDVQVVPEPSTYVLLGLGLGSLVWLRRRTAKA